MRTKEELFSFGEISILLQYLYMNKEHTIIFNNGIVDLEVKMTDNYGFLVLNHNFPDLGWSDFTDMMVVPAILGIIDILKNTSSRQSEYFKTEWEEVKTIAQANLALNHDF